MEFDCKFTYSVLLKLHVCDCLANRITIVFFVLHIDRISLNDCESCIS